MKYIKEYNSDNMEEHLKDALTEISDDREIDLKIISKFNRIYLAIIIDDLFDVTDHSIEYTPETKEKITKTWEEIFRLLDIFKSALDRCDIEYKSIYFEQESEDVDSDGDPYDAPRPPLTLSIIAIISDI